MSYLLQAAIFLPVGVLLAVAILPIGGIIIAVLSVIMLAVGASNNDPGTHAGLCGWLGHDWRASLPGVPAGKTCRNCLKRSDGRLLMRLGPRTFEFAPSAPQRPGYAPGTAPAAIAPGYAAYAPAPMYAPPPPSARCPQCGGWLAFGEPACRACGMPIRWG